MSKIGNQEITLKRTILGCLHDNGEEEIWAIRNLLAQV